MLSNIFYGIKSLLIYASIALTEMKQLVITNRCLHKMRDYCQCKYLNCLPMQLLALRLTHIFTTAYHKFQNRRGLNSSVTQHASKDK